MTLISDIKTKDWTLSLEEQGKVVEQLQDIKQCIYVILMTIPGTDPLRPDFGCDIYKWVDKPVNQAIPNMIKEITTAIGKWEKRAVIRTITPKIDVSSVTLSIEFETVSSKQIASIEVKYGSI